MNVYRAARVEVIEIMKGLLREPRFQAEMVDDVEIMGALIEALLDSPKIAEVIKQRGALELFECPSPECSGKNRLLVLTESRGLVLVDSDPKTDASTGWSPSMTHSRHEESALPDSRGNERAPGYLLSPATFPGLTITSLFSAVVERLKDLQHAAFAELSFECSTSGWLR
jgi:hypothetical protein